MKITPEVAQALANLRGNTDFSIVLHAIEEQTEKERDTCESADGLLLYRAQGAVKALRSLSKAYAEAPQTVQKFKQSPNQTRR